MTGDPLGIQLDHQSVHDELSHWSQVLPVANDAQQILTSTTRNRSELRRSRADHRRLSTIVAADCANAIVIAGRCASIRSLTDDDAGMTGAALGQDARERPGAQSAVSHRLCRSAVDERWALGGKRRSSSSPHRGGPPGVPMRSPGATTGVRTRRRRCERTNSLTIRSRIIASFAVACTDGACCGRTRLTNIDQQATFIAEDTTGDFHQPDRRRPDWRLFSPRTLSCKTIRRGSSGTRPKSGEPRGTGRSPLLTRPPSSPRPSGISSPPTRWQ